MSFCVPVSDNTLAAAEQVLLSRQETQPPKRIPQSDTASLENGRRHGSQLSRSRISGWSPQTGGRVAIALERKCQVAVISDSRELSASELTSVRRVTVVEVRASPLLSVDNGYEAPPIAFRSYGYLHCAPLRRKLDKPEPRQARLAAEVGVLFSLPSFRFPSLWSGSSNPADFVSNLFPVVIPAARWSSNIPRLL